MSWGIHKSSLNETIPSGHWLVLLVLFSDLNICQFFYKHINSSVILICKIVRKAWQGWLIQKLIIGTTFMLWERMIYPPSKFCPSYVKLTNFLLFYNNFHSFIYSTKVCCFSMCQINSFKPMLKNLTPLLKWPVRL